MALSHIKHIVLKHTRFLRFLIVGGIGTAIDFFLFYLFFIIIGWHLVISNSLSYGTGLTSSFFLNRAWTFKDSNNKSKKLLFISIIAGYLGLAINTLLVWGFSNFMPVMIGKVFAVLIVIIYNYHVNKSLVFKV